MTDLQGFIVSVAAAEQMDNIVSPATWEIVHTALRVVKPVQHACKSVERDNATLATVVRHMKLIEEHVDELAEVVGLSGFSVLAKQKMGSRWAKQFDNEASNALAFLNPDAVPPTDMEFI